MHRATALKPSPSAPALALLAFLALAAPAGAASVQQRSDASVRRDIEYARGLAESYGFVDLAEAVLLEVERGGVSARRKEDLALARCEVFAVGARNARDPVIRNKVYDQALSAYERFLREHAQSGRKAEAEAGFVRVSSEYARSLALAVEDASGEEAGRLRKRQEEVLSAAVGRTGELVQRLKALHAQGQLGEGQSRELYDLMLDRGRMLLEVAKTQEDGAFNYTLSQGVLEDLVFTAGEGTPFALRAFAVLGDNMAAQGRHEEAVTFYEQVVEQAIPRGQTAWGEVAREATPAEKEVRWLFVQLGTRGLVESLLADGRAAEAVLWGLHLYNTQRREGFSYQPLGYLSLLAAARALLEAGGWIGGAAAAGGATWYPTLEAIEAASGGGRSRERVRGSELALRIAETVNKDNQGNSLQLRAQRLISEAIDRPGVEVSPEVLIEAALGSYNARDWRAAVLGFKRVLRALEALDEQARRLYAPKTLYHLGTAYFRQDRLLEAAACFEDGCTRWLGDPEFDSQNAQGFYAAMNRLKSAWPADRTIAQRAKQAEDIVTKVGTDVDAIVFRQAEQLRQDKQFDAAIAKYREVTAAGIDHEKALVKIAVCQYRAGRAEDALARLEDYLGPFLANPSNATTSPARLQRRQEARAEARFYKGLILQERAEKGAVPWAAVSDALRGFEDEFPEQNVMSPWSMRLVVLAELAQDETDAARALLEKMIERYADSAHTGSAALEVYKLLEERRTKALAASDQQAADKSLRSMAELLELGNRTARTPSWANLRRESDHWRELGEWAKAEHVLRKTLEAFSKDPAAERDADKRKAMEEDLQRIQRYVLPDLAEVLLRQQKASDALAILDPLARGEDLRPPREVARAYARAVSGWVDGKDKPFSLVPGAGTDDEQFKQATKYLDQITNAVDKYSCEWVQAKLELAYAYWVWGQRNSRMLDSARNTLGPLEQDYGPGFPEVERRCQADGTAELGRVLRRKLNWLKEQL